MFYYYGYDISYVLLMIIISVVLLAVQAGVNSAWKKNSRVMLRCGMTGYDAARMILMESGCSNVQIGRIGGNLTDNFDPRTNRVSLSAEVYSGSSAAAVGVAAHECGHAIQYSEGYAPMKLRSAIIPMTRFGSNAAWVLVLIGTLLSIYELSMLGVALFGFAVLFQLATVFVEFDASRRAMAILTECGHLDDDELKSARSMLSAAALTYVAALAVSVVQLLRLLSVANSGKRRR
jgi:hypothetical protein